MDASKRPHRDKSRDRDVPETARRDDAGRWLPGASPNPQGRPKRPLDPLRAKLEQAAPALIEGLVLAAAKGDVAAARILLDRVMPTLKPQEAPQALDLPAEGLAAQASAIIDLTASGELPAGTAATLLGGLASVAKIRQFEVLEARIASLEAALAKP